MKKEFKRENKNRRNCLSMKLKSIDRKRNIVAQDSFVICCCKRKQRKASVGLLCCCYWSRLVIMMMAIYWVKWNHLFVAAVVVTCYCLVYIDDGSLWKIWKEFWCGIFGSSFNYSKLSSAIHNDVTFERVRASRSDHHIRCVISFQILKLKWNDFTGLQSIFSFHSLSRRVLGSVLVCDCEG